MNARSRAKKLFLVELDDHHHSEENAPYKWQEDPESLTSHLHKGLIRARTFTNMSDGSASNLQQAEGFALSKLGAMKTLSDLTSTTGGSSP